MYIYDLTRFTSNLKLKFWWWFPSKFFVNFHRIPSKKTTLIFHTFMEMITDNKHLLKPLQMDPLAARYVGRESKVTWKSTKIMYSQLIYLVHTWASRPESCLFIIDACFSKLQWFWSRWFCKKRCWRHKEDWIPSIFLITPSWSDE